MPTTPPLARPLVIGLSGLGLVGALAACAGATDAGSADSPASDPSVDSGATGGSYADGTYSATGDYQSPGGQEEIEVDLTLEGGSVAAVTVTPQATGGQAAQYQEQFASGIADEVVGKSIDELDVSRVAGSSLTSGGFNAAVDQIKSDAAES